MTGRRGELAFLTAPPPRTGEHRGPPGVSAQPVHLACTPTQALMLHSAACFKAAATAESLEGSSGGPLLGLKGCSRACCRVARFTAL